MKNYRQLVQELPAKSVVFAFGRFNPPTIGHELLFKVIKKIAMQHRADHVIYASRTQDKKKNPLTVDRKLHYLKLMFKGFNFIAANQNERTFLEAVKSLNKKYKNLIMVAGSDRVAEYEGILNRYNGKDFKYDTIQVVSAGERDPDSDNASGMSASKMRQFASKGNFIQFKKGLPNSVRDIDARLLMNEIRQAIGLESIKEEIKFSIDRLREKYFKGEIFHIGDIVESNGNQYEILDRGSNYVTVVDFSGNLSKKWIKDVKVIGSLVKEDIKPGYAPKEISFKGFTSSNLHHSADATKAFQDTIVKVNKGEIKDPVAVLNALKATDTFMKLNDYHLEKNKQLDKNELETWKAAHEKAKESLENIGEFLHHRDYWDNHGKELMDMMSDYKEKGNAEVNEDLTQKTIRPADKIKVARIIADMLGVEKADNMSSPTQLINMGMRKVKTKVLRPEMINVLKKMLKLADDLDIRYDKATLHAKLKESTEVDKKSDYNLAKGVLRYNDFLKLMKLNKLGGGTNPEIDDGESVGWRPAATGSTLDVDHHLRRRKVKYHLGEEAIEEQVFTAKKSYKEWLKDKGLNHTPQNTERYKKEMTQKEDVASSDYKLSKSGRKVPAKHLIDKDAKRGDDKAPEKENERKLKKEKDIIQKAHQGEVEESYDEEDNEMEMCDHEGKRIPCSEVPENEIEKMVNSLNDEDDLLDAYDDEELQIVDDETGEVVDDNLKEENQHILEVLSRVERIRAKIRFARQKAKRSRKLKIALKRRSSVPVLNRRARKLAIRLVKQRLAKKPLNKLSVGEKERLERIIQKRKQLIGRVAMRLVPRIRKVESGRLSHKKVTGKPTATGF